MNPILTLIATLRRAPLAALRAALWDQSRPKSGMEKTAVPHEAAASPPTG
jgi:hypothetical protein